MASEKEYRSDGCLRSEDDSSEDDECSWLNDDESLQDVEVEITGLELLLENQSLNGSYRTDGAHAGDESDSGMSSIEVDSLVLARRRLPHLRTKRSLGMKADNDIAMFDAADAECDIELPLGVTLSEAFKRKQDSDMDTDTTSSDDEWESMTVDSLIITRRRLASKRRVKPRRVDSLLLARRRQSGKKGEPTPRRFGHRRTIHSKSHHVHYTRLDEIISSRGPNHGGVNCAA